RLEAINSQVSTGLADIVHRCLAADPDQRYPDAETLGADLRRHLGDLPLRGVPNRSLRERWQKWRRRPPHAAVSVLLAALLVTVLGADGGWSLWQRWDYGRREQEQQRAAAARVAQAEKTLSKAQRFLGEQKYELALVTLENGKELLRGIPQAPALQDAIQEHEQFARRQYARQALHEGVNGLRSAVVAERLSEMQMALLEAKCRELWDKREWIIPDKEMADERTCQDMVDLTVIRSELAMRFTASADLPSQRRRLIAVLDEAERRCGGSALLDYLREQH